MSLPQCSLLIVLYLLPNWLHKHFCFWTLYLFFDLLLDFRACFLFLLQKIENLKETTCVSQNLTHFPSCLSVCKSVPNYWTPFLSLFFSEHGRVHQTLYCTATNRQGKHNMFDSFLCSLVCYLIRPYHHNHCSCETTPVCTVCFLTCVSGVVPCLQLLSGSLVDECVAWYSFHHMFYSALEKEMKPSSLLHVVVRWNLAFF